MTTRLTTEEVIGSLSAPVGDRVVTALTFTSPRALRALVPEGGPGVSLARAATMLDVDLAFVPSWVPWAASAVRNLLDAGIVAAWVVRGPMWPALEAQGLEIGLRMTVQSPEALTPGLDAQVERSRAALQSGARLGASVAVIAEDLAGNHGPLVAPDFVFDEVAPRLEVLVATAREHDMPPVLHSDGDIRLFVRALGRSGIVAVHAGGGLDREAFERLFWAARRAGLGFLGGISTRDLVTPTSAVFAGTTASLLARAGGLVVADDGGIEDPAHLSQLVTALAAARTAFDESER